MSVKIVYRPVNKESKDGYLKVRIIENRVQKIKSLGIKIEGKNWLDSKQRVSKNETNHDAINNKLTEVLKDLNHYDNDIQVLTTSNKTILEFFQNTIDTTINQGTKLKYIGIRNKFINYLASISYSDLKFNQLTNQKVREFHKYMCDNGNEIDSANYNLRSFKTVINKAIQLKLVTYINDPFFNITLKFSSKRNKALTADDIKTLISINLVDSRKFIKGRNINLNEVRNIFLFQFFSQGLRSSDVILLRWSNFQIQNDVIKIDYTQFKTKKGMTLILTPMALKMLNNPLFRLVPTLKEQIEDIELRKEDHINEILKYKQLSTPTANNDVMQVVQLASIADDNYKPIAKEHANKQANNIAYKGIIAMNEELLKKIEYDVYNAYLIAIQSIVTSDKVNDFVFYFLNNNDYSNFTNKIFDNLSHKQYSILTSRRAYYNQMLKLIQKQAKIQLTLTSHIARHTYTQLLLENQASVIDISQSLGHSDLRTTQKYISKLPSSNVTTINTLLSNQFST
ncbi:tyrosine-type recombinase/integrase [Flavobacterium granuli]|uniref:Integrase n=1 Tax=Flavobacterium granuli TaxID=280093 RepID=A0ABU1S1B5_9FLAO|nr:tyrosine-type recombinase/integrase [Flavobacterium granuli]MDR6844813.1 integrase [Flavobacterium granuli]